MLALIQVCMAMPAATAALMLRVDPNWAIDTVERRAGRASSVIPGPSWPKTSRQSRGQRGLLQAHRARHVVDRDHGQTGAPAAKASSSAVVSWWRSRW